MLAVWGKNDEIFVPARAEAFRVNVDGGRLEVHLLDVPHFALEGREELFTDMIMEFLGKHWV